MSFNFDAFENRDNFQINFHFVFLLCFFSLVVSVFAAVSISRRRIVSIAYKNVTHKHTRTPTDFPTNTNTFKNCENVSREGKKSIKKNVGLPNAQVDFAHLPFFFHFISSAHRRHTCYQYEYKRTYNTHAHKNKSRLRILIKWDVPMKRKTTKRKNKT